MYGYTGRVLKIDLASGTSEHWHPPDEWYRDYVGGEGLAARLFCELADLDAPPSDHSQPLIFATGPLTGTAAPASGRSVVVFRSPASGAIGASNCGGFFGRELKRAGWDAVVVFGVAQTPVILHLDEDGAAILDGSGLWGKGIADTEAGVRDLVKDSKVQVASIGPAGENGVMFASIMTDEHRAWGRGGPGVVMGGKKIKAIAVRGARPMPVADAEALKRIGAEAREELMAEHFVGDYLSKHGTPTFYDAISACGILPTKNWHRGEYPESIPALGFEAFHSALEVKAYACSGCPIGCGRLTKIVGDSKWAGMEGGGPEYEAVAAFGSKPLVDDLAAIAAANHIANDLGMDVISAGQTITTAIEWYESGLIDDEQTGGLKLNWGNGEAVVELVGKIGRREGFGDLLADGVQRAAAAIGAEADEAAMHVKGVEMPADGVNASRSMSIVQACSARGADHLRPYTSAIDALGYRSEELGIEGDIDPCEDGSKAWVKPLQELAMATNLMGVCLFTVITLAVRPSTWARLMGAALGSPYSKEDLLKASERVINLERLMNARFGFDRGDDTLPSRFLSTPIEDGKGAGTVVDLDVVLDSYYEAMGWERESGLPSAGKRQELGLDWVQAAPGSAPPM